MRLPLQAAYAPVGPGGGVVTAMSGQNALLNQMYQNQIAQAQAQYAPAQQQGIAMQEQGYGQNALAQGRFAPQYFQGQANTQTGLGQQELAAGMQAPAQQAATTQTMQALANQSPAQQAATTVQLQQGALNQEIVNKYLPQVQQANIAGTTIPVLNQVLHNLILAGVSPQSAQIAVNELAQAARQINPKAPTTPINPSGWLTDNGASNQPGKIGNVSYSATRQRNGRTEYKVNGVWGYPQ